MRTMKQKKIGQMRMPLLLKSPNRLTRRLDRRLRLLEVIVVNHPDLARLDQDTRLQTST